MIYGEWGPVKLIESDSDNISLLTSLYTLCDEQTTTFLFYLSLHILTL